MSEKDPARSPGTKFSTSITARTARWIKGLGYRISIYMVQRLDRLLLVRPYLDTY